MSNILKVQIVEDDTYIRNRLAQLVEQSPEMMLMAASATCVDAKRALQALPDILLVDLGLPDGGGEELIRLAVEQSHDTVKCIVFSVFGDEKRVVAALEAGASGYLLKDTDIEDVPAAMINMTKGHVPISPRIARHLLKRFYAVNKPESSQACIALSVREIEVLEYVAKGFSTKEIARLLDVSYHTVVAHIKKIYKKLKVNSRSEAVFQAQQAGIIDMGTPSA